MLKSKIAIHWVYFVNISNIPDIDNNGILDADDFQCMAVRACVVEGKGECSADKLKAHRAKMEKLWKEISDLADFDKVSFIIL